MSRWRIWRSARSAASRPRWRAIRSPRTRSGASWSWWWARRARCGARARLLLSARLWSALERVDDGAEQAVGGEVVQGAAIEHQAEQATPAQAHATVWAGQRSALDQARAEDAYLAHRHDG